MSSDANVFLWGAQVEEGTAMTSYIHNPFSGQATRAESTSFNEQDVTLTLSIYTGAFTDNPTETNFLKTGKKMGNMTLNGKLMFIYQALSSFNIWHELEPDVNENIIKLLD